MTIPTPAVPVSTIGSEAVELFAPAPQLTLVVDERAERVRPHWIPIVCSALVVGASFFAFPALSDSLTGKPLADATLNLSLGYKALAPVGDVLDSISLFSLAQHFAFLLTYAVGLAAWRVIRWQRYDNRIRKRDELVAVAKALVVMLCIYGVGAIVPRPVARLAVSSRDAVVIDFHSHTHYSWDGRAGFSPEESRRWHHASGFDVAYVTDHSTFAGAERAALGNPARAGDGTVMLSGIEVRDRGNHLVVLGTDASEWRSYTAGDLQERIFQREAEARGSARPVVLFTLPGQLKSEGAMAVDGLELSDAAPRGLGQSDALRQDIISRAKEQKKTLVASSNNHGWASASPAWSVMEIHDWRQMTPAQLDIAIRRQILRDGWNAVRIIDRRPPGPTSRAGLALTVPETAWRMLTTISWPERASWLIWIWATYLLAVTIRKIVRTDGEAQPQSKAREFHRWRRAASIV